MTGGTADVCGASGVPELDVLAAASEVLKQVTSTEEVWGKLLVAGYPPAAIAPALERLAISARVPRTTGGFRALDQQISLLAQISVMEGMVAESDLPSNVGLRLQSELASSRVLILGSDSGVTEAVRSQLTAVGISDVQARAFNADGDFGRHAAALSTVLTDLAQAESALLVCCTQSGSQDLAGMVNRSAIELQLTVLYHHTHGFQAQIGPLVIPKETACYECFRIRREATLAPWERALLKAADNTGELAATLGTDWLVVDALKLLTKLGEPVSRGRVLFCDYYAGLPEVHTLLRLPRCPVCSEPERPPVKLWNEPA